MRTSLNYALIVICVIYFTLCFLGGIQAVSGLHEVMVHFTLLVWGLVILRHLWMVFYATRSSQGAQCKPFDSEPLISIIIPAYNEGKVIEDALKSMLTLNYSNYEMIIVDDGSSDETLVIVQNFARQHLEAKITVVRQGNAGKAAALNNGIRHSHGDFILCVDADSRLDRDALSVGIRYFETDEKLAAVGGFVLIDNESNLLTQMQQMEYTVSQNFLRKALSYLGVVTIIPGPIGLFKREAILDIGGYSESKDIFAEDAELSMRLLAKGWVTRGSSKMISHTEAPSSLFTLLRQRYRWRRGLFQAFASNLFGLLAKGGNRTLFIATFMATEAFMMDVINFGLIIFFLSYFLAFSETDLLLIWYLILIFIDLSTLYIVDRRPKRFIHWFGLLLLQKFTYSLLLQAWNVFALFDEWRSTHMSWDKLERKEGANTGSTR